MIVIVDYGMGNLRSMQKALEYVGGEADISSHPSTVTKASALILPGVGAFALAMKNLKKTKLLDPIKAHIRENRLFLGICLGFELLFESSTEDGMHGGLGIFKGDVRKFPFKGTSSMPVPHMGWNVLSVPEPFGMFDKKCDETYFYFVHSYYVRSQDPSATFAYSYYGIRFPAAVQRGNIFGCQFHPEKSGVSGLRIIKYFVERAGARK